MGHDIELADMHDLDSLVSQGLLSCADVGDSHLEAIARTRLGAAGSSPVTFLSDAAVEFAVADVARGMGSLLSPIHGMAFLAGPDAPEGSSAFESLVAAGAVPLGTVARRGRNPFGGCPVDGTHAAVSLGLAAFAVGGSDGAASGGAGRAGVVGCAGLSCRSLRDAETVHAILTDAPPRRRDGGRDLPVTVRATPNDGDFRAAALLLRLGGFATGPDADRDPANGVEVRCSGLDDRAGRFRVSIPGHVDATGVLRAVTVSAPADRPDAAFAVAACLEREFGLRERVIRTRAATRAERLAA